MLGGLLAVYLCFDQTLFYPVRLFVTLVHEMGHALAALATGGRVERIEILPALGGRCHVLGGWPAVFIPAGYLGSLAFGSLIVLAAARSRSRGLVALLLGAGLVLMTALYVRTAAGILGGVLFGALLVASGSRLPEAFNDTLLSFLGVATMLHSSLDLKLLLTEPGLRHLSDAALMSRVIPLPPIVWALLWMLAALAAAWLALRASLRGSRGSSR